MSIDITFFISNVIIFFVSFMIFYFNIMIYKRVVGGSYAYRCWATAAFFILLFSIVGLIGGFIAGSDPLSSSNLSETFRLISLLLNAIGFFYIPVGVLYLSSDIGVYHLNQKKIRQFEIGWIILMVSCFSLFFVLIFNFYVVKIFSIFFNVIFALVWTLTIIVLYPFYKETKKADTAWTYLFIGIICALCENISSIIRYMGITMFKDIVAVFDALLGIFFIMAFYKLGKTLQAF